MKQIPNDPRKTKQIVSTLQLAKGERTELAINVRTEDGMTNGASNVVKKIILNQPAKPSGIIWVKFDHADVGDKTRRDNRHLCTQNIKQHWTPIKPITTQFAVGKNRTAHIIRKQFPLQPAAAKTVHRSQGDTEENIVVNFATKRSIPHIHYVGLSRVTTINGLYVTDLCEDKIMVSSDVLKMSCLHNERSLQISMSPPPKQTKQSIKLCFPNARSLHRHIDDVRCDLYYTSSDMCMFVETRFSQSDTDNMYTLEGFTMLRNDGQSSSNSRPYGGTAIYSKLEFALGFPYHYNRNGTEITVTWLSVLPNVNIMVIYRSPIVPVQNMCAALQEVLHLQPSPYQIIIGYFKVNWFDKIEKCALFNLLTRDYSYKQLISQCTTDNRTCIDHVYTNIPEKCILPHVRECYFSDHKPICLVLEHSHLLN